MARGKRGRGGRRGGGNNSFGEHETDNNVRYYYSSERGSRSGQVYHVSRGRYRPTASFAVREHNSDNGRYHGGDGWQGIQRSGGYAGFSAGSFGVMGDVDSVNRSATQSPEVVCSTDLPLDSVEDLRCKEEQIRENYSPEVKSNPSMKSEEVIRSGNAHGSTLNVGVSNGVLNTAVVDKKDLDVGDLPHNDDGSVISTNADQKLLHAQKITTVTPPFALEHGTRPRAMSYHAVSSTGVHSNIANRRHRSNVVIDRDLAQYLSRSYSQSGRKTSSAQMGEDAATFGTTIAQMRCGPSPQPFGLHSRVGSEHRSHDSPHSTVSASEANLVRYRDDQAQKRRSVSQTVLDEPCVEKTPFLCEEAVRSQRSISRTLKEESEGFIRREEEQIRSVQNDDHYYNHRLSKLSIHTNNDEFFYLGGHPPSDGRASLRSKGSISRQSMHSTDFLAGSNAGVNSDWPETVQTSANRHSLKGYQIDAGEASVNSGGEVFVDTTTVEQTSVQEPIPTIQVNGKALSATSVTSPNYVTAQDHITAPVDDDGFMDAVPRAQAGCSTSVAANYASEYNTAVTGAPSAFTSSFSSDVASSYKSSVRNISYTSAVELTEAKTNYGGNSDGNVQDALQMSNTNVYTSNPTMLKSAQSSSRQSVRSNVCIDVYDTEPQKLHLSSVSPHASSSQFMKTAQSASHQSMYFNASNNTCVEEMQTPHGSNSYLNAYNPTPIKQSNLPTDVCEETPQPINVSVDSLHACNPILQKTKESTSRQCRPVQVSTSGQHVSSPVIMTTTQSASRKKSHSSGSDVHDKPIEPAQVRTTSLHTSDSVLLKSAQSASHQSTRSNIYDEQLLTSTTSLRSSSPAFMKTAQSLSRQSVKTADSLSRQSMHCNSCNDAYDEADQPVHVSVTSLHASNTALQKSMCTASRQSVHSNLSAVANDEAAQPLDVSTTSLHTDSLRLKTTQSSSQQSVDLNVNNDDYCETRPAHAFIRSLHSSNPVLQKTTQSVSGQSLHSNVYSDACEEATQPRLVSDTQPVLVSNTELQTNSVLIKTTQPVSHQKNHLDAYNDVYGEVVQPMYVPVASLHELDPMLLKTTQSVSRDSANSDACSDTCYKSAQPIYVSSASLHTSNPALTKTVQSFSPQSVHSNIYNDVFDQVTQPIYGSTVSLHASNPASLMTAQSVSCRNIHSNVLNDDVCLETGQSERMSTTSLHASESALLKASQSTSRRSVCSDVCYTAAEGESEPVQILAPSICVPNTDILETVYSTSHQNVHSDAYGDVGDGSAKSTHASSCNVYDSDQLKTAQSTSHRTIHSNTCSVAGGETAHQSSNSLLSKTAQSASQQNLPFNVCSDACGEIVQPVRLSTTSLHAPDPVPVKTTRPASRQSGCKNCDEGFDEVSPSAYASISNVCAPNVGAGDIIHSLHVSATSLDVESPMQMRTAQSISLQTFHSRLLDAADDEMEPVHISCNSVHPSAELLATAALSASGSSVMAQSESAPALKDIVDVVQSKPERPPMRISMATESPVSKSMQLRSTVSRSDLNNNVRDSASSAQCGNISGTSTEDSLKTAPKPAVRRSMQAIPLAASPSSSRTSVDGLPQDGIHVFETKGGGLWYHFSDIDRNHSRSATSSLSRQNSGSAGKSTTTSLLASQIPPKKPPRSRSSSASRNEVHFSSIPQLLSHPDDRFSVEMPGRTFRSTSEHELTPHAQKSTSRTSIVTAVEATTGGLPHKASVDWNSGLLTVPVYASSTSEITTSEMKPPSRTPSLKSLDVVPSPLIVTDALTPKRPPLVRNEEENYDSPASFNRTLFTKESFRRRRFREPERAEVAIQTGETIRLRQGMSFGEEPSENTNIAARASTTPTGDPTANSASEHGNDLFKKKEYPAATTINNMLEQRLMHSEFNRRENRQPSEDIVTSYSRAETITKEDEVFQRSKLSASSGHRRSFIDNEHHQYETRTNKEWRSSTRSQYEEGKLDENYNEVLGNNTYQKLLEETQNRDYQHTRQKSYSATSDRRYSDISDQVFEEPCSPAQRTDRDDGSPIPYSTQQRVIYNVGAPQPNSTIYSDWQCRGYVDQNSGHIPSQCLHETGGRSASMPDPSNVIRREIAEQLRQKVIAESRPPLTPRSTRMYSYNNQSVPTDTDLLSAKALTVQNGVTSSDFTSYAQPSRISMNLPSSSLLYSPTSSRWRKGNERSGPTSPFKWQVPNIDTQTEHKEPDARSNDSKISGTGSTVRRHIPRGRIRDLARLFDKMTMQAEQEAAVLRGKSLPPPKHRSKYTRTRSMPRPQDLPAKKEGLRQEQKHHDQDQAMREVPMPYNYADGDVVSGQGDYAEQREHGCGHRSSVNEAIDLVLPSCGDEYRKLACNIGLETGMLPHTNNDRASTDSRLDLQRTSTPLANSQDVGDLVNAFGRVPSIHSPDATALCGEERVPSTNIQLASCRALSGDTRNLQIFSKSADQSFEHHHAKPAIVKLDSPPHRLSVIQRDNTHHGHYVQHKRSYSHQHHVSNQPDGEPTYARINRVSANQHRSQSMRHEPQTYSQSAASESTQEGNVGANAEAEKVSVNGEIDKMFEFVEDQDGLSTIGHETISERTSIVKADAYGTVHGVTDHLAELPPKPPQPPAPPHGLDMTALSSQNATQPLKYSVSAYRDMQRTHRMGGHLPSNAPPRFSPLTAPTAGIGVSTYKSREGTIGEKVNTYSQFSRNTSQYPSALATSTPIESLAGTGFSQRTAGVPNFDDSFISAITTGTHPRDAHEEYKRQMTKLSSQIRVQEEQIEMTLKVLALARKKQKCMQELSAQRTLLLARERLDLLRCEVSRISALAAVRNPPPPVNRELRGTMTISNICVYLNRSFCQRQYENESSYALLILLKCGSEVEATGPVSLLAHTQNRVRQLTFAENVQFSNLPVDFNVLLEVYAMKLPIIKTAENSCASNIANKCKNLLSPALAHRSSYQDGSEFIRCGYIILNRDTVGMNKFYLDEAEYPLEGTIEVYCRCTTLPPAIEVENRGFLTMYQTINGIGSWERYWAVLRRGMVYFWRYPDDESLEKRPVAFMDLSKCTNDSVSPSTQEQCPRENSFNIDMLVCTTPSLMEKKRVLLSADSEELLHAWLQALNETLSVLRG